MSFTGKSSYSAGASLPETSEDVSDIISIVSPYETTLLDYLGDSNQFATSTIHEWLEDRLQQASSSVADVVDLVTTDVEVLDADVFYAGDLIRVDESEEVLLVTNNAGQGNLSVVRGYGGTTKKQIAVGTKLFRIGGAALEGENASSAQFTSRVRKTNYTQIFTSTVEVSGSLLACKQIGIADELDYQKQERLRELLRDLENSVINGVPSVTNPQGTSTTRRSMKGIIPFIETNVTDAEGGELTEERLNTALKQIWEQSAGHVDTIIVNGHQKRKINSFISSARGYGANDSHYKDYVGVYESDFGVCRVILSRWVPTDKLVLLDSSRVSVMPLNGRSFHYKPLASTGDYETGQVIGEYTMEFRNENAHGVIRNLSTS